MRYRLRTLLIVLAVGPPLLGLYLWPEVEFRYTAWLRHRQLDSIAPPDRLLFMLGVTQPHSEAGRLTEITIEIDGELVQMPSPDEK